MPTVRPGEQALPTGSVYRWSALTATAPVRTRVLASRVLHTAMQLTQFSGELTSISIPLLVYLALRTRSASPRLNAGCSLPSMSTFGGFPSTMLNASRPSGKAGLFGDTALLG